MRNNPSFNSILILYIALISLASCKNTASSDISEMKALADKWENQTTPINEKSLEALRAEFQAIDNRFQANRKNFTEEQIAEFNRQRGRLWAVIAKKGVNDFLEKITNGLKDLNQQIEGATKELIDSVN